MFLIGLHCLIHLTFSCEVLLLSLCGPFSSIILSASTFSSGKFLQTLCETIFMLPFALTLECQFSWGENSRLTIYFCSLFLASYSIFFWPMLLFLRSLLPVRCDHNTGSAYLLLTFLIVSVFYSVIAKPLDVD